MDAPTPNLPDGRRERIKRDLKEHMEAHEISASRVIRFVNDRPDKFGGFRANETQIRRFFDPEEGKVHDNTVLVFERYLIVWREENPDATGLDERTARLFGTAKAFFRVTPEKIEQYRDAVCGVFTLYAYSEKDPRMVCRGAINFFPDKHGELCVYELQESTPPGASRPHREEHIGQFIFRDSCMTVLLRDKLNRRPKFYVMSIMNSIDGGGRVLYMEGSLLKIGVQKDVFTTNVVMVRSDSAFSRCALVDPDDLPPQIQRLLDSQKWGPPK